MSIEHTLVREVLCWLQDRYWSWQRNPSGPALKFLDRVHQRFTEFPEAGLNELLAHHVEFDAGNQNKYIFLKPINEGGGIIPILSFHYNFQPSKAELRLRVALFVPDGNSDVAAIGCRFEPPEGPGTHNYFHAQMFREFRAVGGSFLPSCPAWLPCSTPAFQLKAYDPVTLLISMVISLYGIGVVQDLGQTRFANELKCYIDKLCPTAAVPKSRPSAEPAGQRVKGPRR